MARSEVIRAAWITGTVGAVGTIVGAVVTGGFGLINSKTPAPSPSVNPPATVAPVVSAPPTPTPTPNANGNQAAVPASYQGTWTGEVSQSNDVSYQLTLKIGPGNVGTAVGSWQVPTFGCSGELDLESGGGPLELRQGTTFNPTLQCFSQFEVSVTLQGAGLDYQILGVTTTNGEFIKGNPVFGTATLSPQ